MSLKPGTILGRYEIRSLIGAGGMGEVYLARDPKIARDVAVKVLPANVVGDGERLARFEQEAQAAGALNHPNILSIYDVDSDNGTTFVVSELLKGETLRDIMGTEPLSIRKAINYALQTAHGLAAAHERGIIHRDIKPENLMITADGRVKILDFGLAKLTEFDRDGVQTELPTRRVNTDTGSVMGTVGYMSPEQLRGQPVDTRTDIFSFGTVLYEMLSGRKAFQRDSTADTISAILREDPPDLSETNSSVNSGLERIVRRCLEKNREERFQSASDLAFALESLSGIDRSGQINAVQTVDKDTGRLGTIRSLLPWALAGVLFLTAAGFAWLYLRRAEPTQPVMRFTLTPPEKSGFGESLALSPDGSRLVYVVISDKGESSLWVRHIASPEPQQVAGTDGAEFPFWSPDGHSVGFFAGSKLKRVDVNGGPVQVIAECSTDPRGGTWTPDGSIIFTPGTGTPLYKVAAGGGTPIAITQIDESRGENSHRWPWVLPDGRHYLYFVRGGAKDNEGVALGTLDSSERKMLFPSKVAAIYARPDGASKYGRVLTVRDGSLIAQSFDESKLSLVGEPSTVAQDVRSYPTEVGPTAALLVSVSNTGGLVYRTGGTALANIAWADRSGKQSDPISPPGLYHEPMISPDGKRVVVSRFDGNNQDLWIFDTSRNVFTRFTFDPATEGSAIWAHNGTEIIYSSTRTGKSGIFRKSANGLGGEEMLYSSAGNSYPDAVSPDGKFLLFETDNGAATKFDLMLLPLEGADRTPLPLVQSEFQESHAQFSPDGRWFSYVSDSSGRAEVYVRSFGNTGGQWQISTNGGDQPMWNPKAKEICYVGFDRSLYSVRYEDGQTFQPGAPELLFQSRLPPTGIADERNNYLITPDGSRFMMINLVDVSRSSPIVMVLNWTNELK